MDHLRWVSRVTRQNCVTWLGEGKGVPPMVMAFRDDGFQAIVIPRNFSNPDEKMMAWTEAATIIPAIGAQRAIVQSDAYIRLPRPGEKREDFEAAVAAHVNGRSLADDPGATEVINVIAYDGVAERMDAIVMPYTLKALPPPEKRMAITWGHELDYGDERDGKAAGWMADMLEAMVKASVANRMPPLLQGMMPAILKEMGHKVIIDTDRQFSFN